MMMMLLIDGQTDLGNLLIYTDRLKFSPGHLLGKPQHVPQFLCLVCFCCCCANPKCVSRGDFGFAMDSRISHSIIMSIATNHRHQHHIVV